MRVRRLLGTGAVFVSLVALGAASATGSYAANVQASGLVLWGAYISGAPQDSTLLDTFESGAGKKLSIVHWGEAWTRNGSSQQFQTTYFQTVRNRGSIPMLTWGSWDSSQGPNQPAFQL